MRFDDQVVVVTGAGRGLGRAHARLLASRGAAVVVCDAGVAIDGSALPEDPAAEVVAEIRAEGGRAIAYLADLRTEEGARGAVRAAVDAFGGVDAVIHNAGMFGEMAPVATYSNEGLAAQLDVNLWAGLWLTQAAWPHLLERGGGRLVFTTSNATYGVGNMLGYVVAKNAVIGLTRTVAAEGSAVGIRANALAPMAYSRLAEGASADFARWMRETCGPERVAPAAVYLAHAECALNGQLLIAGGGRVGRMFQAENHGFVDADVTPEAIRDRIDEAMAIDAVNVPGSLDEAVGVLVEVLGGAGGPRVLGV